MLKTSSINSQTPHGTSVPTTHTHDRACTIPRARAACASERSVDERVQMKQFNDKWSQMFINYFSFITFVRSNLLFAASSPLALFLLHVVIRCASVFTYSQLSSAARVNPCSTRNKFGRIGAQSPIRSLDGHRAMEKAWPIWTLHRWLNALIYVCELGWRLH